MGEDLQGTEELEGSQPAFSIPAWVLASLLGSQAKPFPSSYTEPKLPPLHLPRKDLFPSTGFLSLGPPSPRPCPPQQTCLYQPPANSRAECLNPNNSKTGTQFTHQKSETTRNISQMKEQGKHLQDQIKEEETGKLPEKG